MGRISIDQSHQVISTLVANVNWSDRVEWAESKDFTPHSYFKTREGLWVSDEFRSRILSKAGVVSVGAAVGKSYDLTKNAYDREITPELGTTYQFESESELCAYIAQMIEKQPNGAAGELLNNGYANIFYVAGCVVGVYWYGGRRLWRVNAWELGDDYWRAGARVFSRN